MICIIFHSIFLWKFIDNLQNTELAINYFVLFLVLSIWLSVLNFIYRRFFEKLEWYIPLNFLENYFEKIYNQNYYWHINNSTWYISSILQRVAWYLWDFYVKITRKYIPYLVGVILFFIYSYNLSIYLLIYLISFISFILIVIRISYNKRYQIIKDNIKKNSIFYKNFIDFLYNIKTLKKLYIKDFALNNISSIKNDLYKTTFSKLMNLNSYQWFFSEFMIIIMFCWPIIYYLMYAINNNWEWLWTIIILYSAMPIFKEFNRDFMELLRHLSRSKWDLELLKEKIDILEDTNEKWKKNPKTWSKIIFKDTKYEYIKKEKSFSHHIDFLEINISDKIAIIWKSGSGKTTFLNLLTNNIKVQTWEIKIDKINYNNISHNFFKNNLTYISQDIELFDMSLKDNIILWKKVQEKEIIRILKWVWLSDLLKRIKNDLSIIVWEKWIKLSAWERQRINIARGLILKRNIMVFDEITANLDKKTTKQVWDFIFSECRKNTIIIVSHEEQIFNYVERVIEFKNWKIIKIKSWI